MVSIFQAISGVLSGGQDIVFLNDVLKQYRETRKVFHYSYTQEDTAALQKCATDMRPFAYSFLPAGGLFYGLGKLVKEPKQLGLMTRATLVLLRLMAAGEVFRLGYLVGSYKQGMDCTQRLVSLRTPLGGEIAAIIRSRDPNHPLLKYERAPAELNEDGTRPRIVSEANRLAQIEHFRRELAQAHAGREVDRANERAEERLYQVLKSHADVQGEIQRGGGPTAAASAGSMEAMRPQQPRTYREQVEAASAASAASVSAGMGGAPGGGVRHGSGGGLVISDGPAPQQQGEAGQLQAALAEQLQSLQQHGGSAAAAGAAVNGPASGSSAGGSQGEADPFATLLGGDSNTSGGWFGEELDGAAARERAEEEARQRRKRERRKSWWWRHGGRAEDGI